MKKKLIIFSVIAVISLLLFIIISAIIKNDINTPSKLDTSIRDFFYDIRGNKGNFLYYLCRILTEISSKYGVIVIALIFIIFTKCDNRALSFIIGALLMILINYALKDIYQRERPIEELRWVTENDLSYPSGHSTASGFTFMFIAYFLYDSKFNKWIKIVGYILCGLLLIIVPTTRLMFGVHYFTDIISGLLNGIFVGSISIILLIIFKQYDIFNKPLFISIYELLKDDDNKEELKEPKEEKSEQ